MTMSTLGTYVTGQSQPPRRPRAPNNAAFYLTVYSLRSRPCPIPTVITI